MKWFQSTILSWPRILSPRSMSVFGIGAVEVLRATRLLLEGKVIALPTDTIYGLAVLAQDTVAVQQLYKTKDRDCRKPIAICVENIAAISTWGQTSTLPAGLLESLLPGPVTIVLNRTPLLNPALNPNTEKVGIRIPDHPFIREITKRLNSPLALTSANRSNEPSCVNPCEFEGLWPLLGGVFNGGTIGKFRAGSTVVDLSESGKYQIVRPGSALDFTRSVLDSFQLVQTGDPLLETDIVPLNISKRA